jgi:hypothetical protein
MYSSLCHSNTQLINLSFATHLTPPMLATPPSATLPARSHTSLHAPCFWASHLPPTSCHLLLPSLPDPPPATCSHLPTAALFCCCPLSPTATHPHYSLLPFTHCCILLHASSTTLTLQTPLPPAELIVPVPELCSIHSRPTKESPSGQPHPSWQA